MTAIQTDHLATVAGGTTAVEVGEESLPLGGAVADDETELDDLLLAVRPNAEHHQDREAERVRNGLAREHDPTDGERLVAYYQRLSTYEAVAGHSVLRTPR